MTENSKNTTAGKKAGEGVKSSYDVRISVHVVSEGIVRRIHDDVSKTHRQGEENLSHCGVPVNYFIILFWKLLSISVSFTKLLVRKFCPTAVLGNILFRS